jgi:hypothetical protein
MHSLAGEKPESQCLFGTLGKIGQRRMPIKTDSLWRNRCGALDEYRLHYHAERNHQGKENILLFPQKTAASRDSPLQCRE